MVLDRPLSHLAPYGAAVLLWALAVASRIVWHGEILGLDFDVFQPDGRAYFEFSRAVAHGGLEEVPALVRSRPMYPLLSAPFAEIAGRGGMLVVPAVSFLIVAIVLVRVGSLKQVPWVGTALFGALSFSTTVTRWTIADITDGPLLAVFSLSCYWLLRGGSHWVHAALVVLGILTRPVGPVWALMFVGAAWGARRSDYRRHLTLAIFSVTLTMLVWRLASASSYAVGSMASSVASVVVKPWTAIRVLGVEIAELAVLDRWLLALLLSTLFLAWRDRSEMWARVYLLTLFSTSLLDVWVGVLGVNFRYQLPALIPMAIMVINRVGSWVEASTYRDRSLQSKG